MTTIAVLHTKGGVSKTTTALNLAIGRALQGRNVLAVDGDPQGSLLSALSLRDVSRSPSVAVAQYVDGKTLRQQVERAKQHYDDIVIDAGGRDNTALRAALLQADLVVVPFAPRSYDVWSLEDMLAIVEEARAIRDVDVRALLTMSDPHPAATDNAEALAAVPESFSRLTTTIGRRKSIADAAGQGLSVLELPPSRDPKAAAEFKALLAELFPSN